MYADLSMQANLLEETLGKNNWPFQRREMAATAVVRRGVAIAPACRTFGVSESCYRYSPKLRGENEEIANLLIGLTNARKTWGSTYFFTPSQR
jgi:hypothetical protein